MRHRYRPSLLGVPDKANRVLHLILLGMAIIVLRVWHLAVIQHEVKVEEAARPRKKIVIEPAKRATIRDRFNIPLAVNQVKYQAGILYQQIRDIPAIQWEKNDKGKKVKRYRRKEYVKALAEKLGEELGVDPGHVEDEIYAKGVFLYNVPYLVKDDLTEEEYYRLKMEEKNWPGLMVQRVYRRHYPQGKVAAHVIGYLGAINKNQYEAVIHEMRDLRVFLREVEEGKEGVLPAGFASSHDVKRRLKELEEKAYTINDTVGKTGIEAAFEESLRGRYGKKVFSTNAQGTRVRELPGSLPPRPGQRLLLTISSELQAYAEQLLIDNETLREKYLENYRDSHGFKEQVKPWIRGGAIVVMDPKEGDLITLASYPRFDPNDFIFSHQAEINYKKKEEVRRWLEGEGLIGRLYDQKQWMIREVWNPLTGGVEEEKVKVTWEVFLASILPKESPAFQGIQNVRTVKQAADVGRFYEEKGLEGISSYFPSVEKKENRLLVVDLCRVAVDHSRFSQDLLKEVGRQTLADYRDFSAAWARVEEVLKGFSRDIFHVEVFHGWRKEHEKEFLKGIRREEDEKKTYHRPFTDILAAKEEELFKEFWEKNKWVLVEQFLMGKKGEQQELGIWYQEIALGAHRGLDWVSDYLDLQTALKRLKDPVSYLQTMRSYKELTRPLVGRHRGLKGREEKDLAGAFYPSHGYGCTRSFAYAQQAVQGSVFKVVTAYTALIQRAKKGLRPLNPLVIVDEVHRAGNGWTIGTFENGIPIPRMYKGGRIPKSLSRHIGKIDIVGALEHSSNPYFALLCADHLEKPNDLIEAARSFSYGAKTGIDLPGEISGSVPKNLNENATGLYACSIGQGELVAHPLQTAVMLSAIANGGKVLKPKIVSLSIGAPPPRQKEDLFPFQESLSYIGIDFPLFDDWKREEEEGGVHPFPTSIVHALEMPTGVKKLLWEGMHKAVMHIAPERLAGVYRSSPALVAFQEERSFLYGKTSSAERVEVLHLDPDDGVHNVTHIWFGGFSLKGEGVIREEPDVVIVVYLRNGSGGKDAVPLAAQVAKKWREICTKR